MILYKKLEYNRKLKRWLIQRVSDKKTIWVKTSWLELSGTKDGEGNKLFVARSRTKAIRLDNADWK